MKFTKVPGGEDWAVVIKGAHADAVDPSISPETTKFEASLKPKPVIAMSTVHAVSLSTKTHGNVPSLETRFPIVKLNDVESVTFFLLGPIQIFHFLLLDIW